MHKIQLLCNIRTKYVTRESIAIQQFLPHIFSEQMPFNYENESSYNDICDVAAYRHLNIST